MIRQSVRNILKILVDRIIFFESMIYPVKHKSGKILILRKDGLGDCILFLPFLDILRKHYHDKELVLVFPAYIESLSPLLRDMDQVIWFDHKRFSNSFFYRRKFLLDLKRQGFETAIYPVYTREPIGDFMMQLTCAKQIIGFDNPDFPNGPYTHHVHIPEMIKEEFARNQSFTEALIEHRVTVTFPTIDLRFLPSSAAKVLANEFKLASKDYAIIFPGSGATYKIWPRERFAQAITHIYKRGIVPVICGTQKERKLAEEIASLLDEETKKEIIILSGRTDLSSLSHLLARSKFYFGSDTGILHLAVALGVPAAAIVGSGSVGRFFPYGDPQKNRAITNPTDVPTDGTWTEADLSKRGIHTSIENISTAMAIKEIDALIDCVKMEK